ncbi:zinc-finger domain-containing protein [Jeotgalibacillus salarius]|uniref:Zinc-finger domain-containing protein n=2 Tax=Jeotgalibacillus salarius TaxID=546023 RepID=A0A4Y8LKD8_9BACL|nr:zinc-finger domain-containing protein [Jeotgalibacillus salarius]TFE03032.1 zinc-finger domain-containing protein [Jeotgalibacillus salarius]
MEKMTAISELDELMNTYCTECPVKKELRSEKGKLYAHKFCISECSIGLKLKEIGRRLS